MCVQYLFLHVCAISCCKAIRTKLLNIIKLYKLYDLSFKIYVCDLGTFNKTDEIDRNNTIDVIHMNENTILYD